MRGRTAPGESAKAPETAAEQAKPCFPVRGPPGLSLEAGPAAGQIGSAAAPGGPGFRRSGSNREKGAGVSKEAFSTCSAEIPLISAIFPPHNESERNRSVFPGRGPAHVRPRRFPAEGGPMGQLRRPLPDGGRLKVNRASKAEIQSQLYRLAGVSTLPEKQWRTPWACALAAAPWCPHGPPGRG